MEVKIGNGYLVLKMPIGQGYPSSTGKSLVVATSGGFIPIPDSNLKVNITVIKPTR